jgi:hypothetical protein
MSNTLKQGAAQLKELAGTTAKVPPAPEASLAPTRPPKPQKGSGAKATVLIGGHFPRVVRRSLAQLQADPRNDGKKINDLLAEALNDLFAKYNVPQTAKLDRESRA